MFDKNGRVERVKEGLRFYEQDVVMCSYIFSEKRVVVDTVIDYITPGFGLVISEVSKSKVDEAVTYLAKVGVDSFKLYRRQVKSVPECLHTESCSLSPDGSHCRLRFVIRHKKVSVEIQSGGSYVKLGEYAFKDSLDSYRIGIYSSAGNIVESMTFLTDMPDNWMASVANTFGGRISFRLDGFSFENCLKPAEIEQDKISLRPGKYYLRYDKSDINGMNDIKCYVFKSESDLEGDDGLEDDKKQLITDDGIITLKESMEVSVKFRGTNGSISKIYLTDLAGGSYIRTYKELESHMGSVVTAALDGVSAVEWTGIITAVPQWNDMTLACPYSIASLNGTPLSKEAAGIELGVRYSYIYNVATDKLSIKEGVNVRSTVKLPGKGNVLTIFQGVSGVITSLTLKAKNNQTVDALLSQSTKIYVPQTIKSPIIVMSDEHGPYDLSSSFKEIVIPHKKVEVFGKRRPLELEERIVTSIHAPHVYGIPEGKRFDQTGHTIKEVCPKAVLISGGCYSFRKNMLSLDEKTRERFSHIAVEYDSIKDYYYLFTNTEREVFSGEEIELKLGMAPRKSNNSVTLYGIMHDADTEDGMFFRVPNKGMLKSIDLYANKYETVPHSLYDVHYDSSSLKLDKELRGKYKQFIVEYEKKDSYCVNLLSELGEYEVSFMSGDDSPYVIYDQHEDGSISSYINTDIQSSKNKYIVLRRREGETF